MRIQSIIAILVFICATAASAAQTEMAGTWRAYMKDVPAVILHLQDDHGKLQGTVVFNIINREDPNHPSILGSQELVLLNPSLAGNVFSFQVKRQSDEGAESGEMVTCRLSLTGHDEGLFKCLNGADSPEVKMVRGKRLSL